MKINKNLLFLGLYQQIFTWTQVLLFEQTFKRLQQQCIPFNSQYAVLSHGPHVFKCVLFPIFTLKRFHQTKKRRHLIPN